MTYTPLIYSYPISKRFPGYDVYLKLETFHPSQSFKYRSLTVFAKEQLQIHGPNLHIAVASSGNGALALSYACNELNIPLTVFVIAKAAQSTMLVKTMESLGSTVVIGGHEYADARRAAEEFVAQNEKFVLASTYDHPALWAGTSTIMDEVAEQLPRNSLPPDAIFVSVGGGSHITGVMMGCKARGWDQTQIVALETQGSDCFYHTILSNPDKTVPNATSHILPPGVTTFQPVLGPDQTPITLVKLSRISSRAASLGAVAPAEEPVRLALERRQNARKSNSGGVTVVSVPDELAMQTALDFSDEHKLLVELAASTMLTPAYSPELFQAIFPPSIPKEERKKTLVFLVCGGFTASLRDMAEYKLVLDGIRDMNETRWNVWVEGKDMSVQRGSCV